MAFQIQTNQKYSNKIKNVGIVSILMFIALFYAVVYSSQFEIYFPSLIKKSLLKELITKYPEIINNTASSRIRSERDFSIWIVRYYHMLKYGVKTRSLKFTHQYNLDTINQFLKDLQKSKSGLLYLNDSTDVSDREFEKNKKKSLIVYLIQNFQINMVTKYD